MAQDSITHFSHPGHELVKRHYMGPSRCDMCCEDLSGPAYVCLAGCDFAIHETCAGHPQTHYTPAHPQHSLVLLQTRHDVAHTCDLCVGNYAAGSFLYRCPPCGFDMHPTCARLPHAAVRSARHPGHDLTLLVVAEGRCAACHRGGGHGWFYRCTVCNIDFHVSCAAGGGEDKNNAGARQDHAGNGHVPGAAQGGNMPVPHATQANDIMEELRRARIRQAHMAIARSSDSIYMLGRIG